MGLFKHYGVIIIDVCVVAFASLFLVWFVINAGLVDKMMMGLTLGYAIIMAVRQFIETSNRMEKEAIEWDRDHQNKDA